MKFATYFLFSLLSIFGIVYYAYYTQRQFYPTVLFLVSSKVSFILLANMVLALALVIARCFKSIFFGQLRDAEVELLIEKAKFTIPETCLALTIFRNELTPAVITLFGSLIFIKLLHKLTKCRLEYLEQIMPVSIYKQIRMSCLLLTLIGIDTTGAICSVLYIVQHGRSVLILFGFEFGLLLIYALNLSARFILQLADMYSANGLAAKGLYVMFIDLICEMTKFSTYFCFFCLIFSYYGMPIHIMRDVWAAYISCQRKLLNFIQYLKLTRNLDSRFDSATAEECAAAGNCLVCREDLDQGKKLPCGHIFHIDCLRMWLQHQQTCPLCRAEIPTSGPRPTAAAVAGAAAADRAEVQPEQQQQQQQQQQEQEAPGDRVVQQQQQQQQQRIQAAALAATGTIDQPEVRITTALNAAIESVMNQSHQSARMRMNHADSNDTTASYRMLSVAAATDYPRFCVVLAVPDLSVRSDPMIAAREVRRMKLGMVVFISLRVEDAAGRGWLRAPDGWLLEQELHNRSIGGGSAAVIPFPDSSHRSSNNSSGSSSGSSGRSRHTMAATTTDVDLAAAAAAVIDNNSSSQRPITGSHINNNSSSSQFPDAAAAAQMYSSSYHSRDSSMRVDSSAEFTSEATATIAKRKPFVPFSVVMDIKDAFEEQEQQLQGYNQKLSASTVVTTATTKDAVGVDSTGANVFGDIGASASSIDWYNDISVEEEIDERLAELRDLLGMEARSTSRHRALYDAINSRAVCRSSSPTAATADTNAANAATAKGSTLRLRHMANVQFSLQTVSKNLAQLSSSILDCQESLAALVKEESKSLRGTSSDASAAASNSSEEAGDCTVSNAMKGDPEALDNTKQYHQQQQQQQQQYKKYDEATVRGEELPLTNESPLEMQQRRSPARQLSTANYSAAAGDRSSAGKDTS